MTPEEQVASIEAGIWRKVMDKHAEAFAALVAETKTPEYRARWKGAPWGDGTPRVLKVMADRLRGGESWESVAADYGVTVTVESRR